MADSYGLFWNSINSDRTYDADSFAEWLRKFFTTGVFNGEMHVIPDSGMVIDVEPGYVNINGKVRFFENMQAFTIDPASGVYPRIDAIVVRSDSAARAITCEYVKGDYSGNTPTAPTPTRTGGIYEIVLANIYVGAGATQILSNDITDTRADSDLCGWVTSTVEGVPMDQIVAQMQAQFMTWFDEMKDQLSEDAAGHLQQEIDVLTAAVNSTATIVQKHDTDFAPTESGTIAEQMHSVGQYFMLDHRLCKAIANIAEGDTLSVGVNFEYVTVGDELTALNAGLNAEPDLLYTVTANGTNLPLAHSIANYRIIRFVITNSDESRIFSTSDVHVSLARSKVFAANLTSNGTWNVRRISFVTDTTITVSDSTSPDNIHILIYGVK